MSVIYKALEKLERVKSAKTERDDSFEEDTKKSFGRVLLSNKKILIILISLFLTAGLVLFFSKSIFQQKMGEKKIAQKKEATYQKINPPMDRKKTATLPKIIQNTEKADLAAKDTTQTIPQPINKKAPPIPLSAADQSPENEEIFIKRATIGEALPKPSIQFIPPVKEKSDKIDPPFKKQSAETPPINASFQKKGAMTEKKKRAVQNKNERRMGRLLDKRHSEMTLVNKLYQSIGMGNHMESERLFHLLSTMKGGEHPFVLNMRAYALILEEKYETAMGFIERALIKNPNDMDAKVNKSVILLKEGKKKEAFEYLTQLKKQYPENDVILSLWKKSIIGKRE